MTLKHPTAVRRFLLAAALFAATFAGTAVQAQSHVSIRPNEGNMRSGPGSGYAVQWSLGKGYPLQVTGKRGQWLRVKDFEADTGWVHKSITTTRPHMIVKAKIANLRQSPTTRSRVLGKLEYGEVVRTLEKRTGWIKIQREDGKKGWTARSLLWGW